MYNITQSADSSTPPVKEPEEYDPVDLLGLAVGKFKWSDEEFATNFGWEVTTIRKWTYGQKVGRSARIRAATLKREWNL